MKRKYVWLLLSCLAALSLMLAACAPAPTTPTAPTAPTVPAAPTTPTTPTIPTTPAAPAVEKPKYGGTLTIAISPDQRGFSPTASGVITSGLYTLHFTNDGMWSGDWAKGPAGTNETDFLNWTWGFDLGTMMLAESYELAADNTLIYHIKKGIRYSLDPKSEASRLANGRELTAADVAYSLNAMYFDPDSFGQWEFIPEEKPLSIEATDKYTVKIRYQPGMTSSTVYSTSTYSYIFPPEVYGKYNKMRDWKHAVGTGGFILVDYLPGSSITMMRSPNGWWKTDPVGPGKGNQLPYVDSVKLLVISDRSTQMAALRTGKIDVLGAPVNIFLDDYQRLMRDRPDLQYVKWPPRASTVVALRVDKPELPWYNKNVRHALSMAIDYNSVIKDYYKGDAIWAYPKSPYRNFLGAYTPPEQWPQAVKDIKTYNPDKAKQLLAEAGYPNGFKISVLTESTYVDDLSLIKEYWRKIGVDMTIDVRDRTVVSSITAGFQQKEAVAGTMGGDDPFDMDSVDPGNTGNRALIDDPYANQVLRDIKEDYVTNRAKIFPMVKDFYLYELEQAWHIALPGPNGYNMWQPWVKNYHGEVDLGPCTRLIWGAYVWVDQALKKSLGY